MEGNICFMNSFIQKTIKIYEKYKWWFWFLMGLLAVFVFLFPYFYLREKAYFMIHDELDDGIFKYMLNAKHFGDGNDYIAEFMGGQSKSSIVTSSFWGIFLYRFLSPYNAFLTMMTISVITGYIGVFLLGKEISDNAFASFFAGSVFSYLPFRSMFALNIVGFPILIWAIIMLAKNKGKKTILPYILVVYYSSGITLVCGGYIAIGFLALAIIGILIFRGIVKKKGQQCTINLINLIIAELILCVIQVLLSWDLIKDTFISSSFVSHREEMAPTIRTDYIDHFFQMIHFGGGHSESCSWAISISCVILICVLPVGYLFASKKTKKDYKKQKYKYIIMCSIYVLNVFNALFSCIWMSEPVVNMRESIGGVIRSFQFDRICWIMPTCWMCILILEVSLLCDVTKLCIENKSKIIKVISVTPIIAAIVIMFIYAKNVYLSSVIYHNLRLIAFPATYHVDTWKDYYAEELFDDIEQAIGKDKSTYRVVSVAFSPAATLFNGFYTLDGYSTDYPLEYKHQFREIISEELDKDPSIKYYYDSWGSRCYIFSTEIPLTTGLNNCKDSIDNLAINTEALKDMGADYIFSNAEIHNYQELSIEPIREAPFVKEGYTYKIWVYEIQ